MIVEQIAVELRQMGLSVPPRGGSMLLLIGEHTRIGVVKISKKLRLSHPLIVRMAQEFIALGLITSDEDPDDARRKQLSLTPKGRKEFEILRAFNERLSAAFETLFSSIDYNLITVLDALDHALGEVSISRRLNCMFVDSAA